MFSLTKAKPCAYEAIQAWLLDNAEITVEALAEDTAIADHFIYEAEEENRAAMNEIERKLDYTQWAWCTVMMTMTFHGLACREYLGVCSYDSAINFQASDAYEDMRREAARRLAAQIIRVCEVANHITNKRLRQL